jgi:hypothetical protein
MNVGLDTPLSRSVIVSLEAWSAQACIRTPFTNSRRRRDCFQNFIQDRTDKVNRPESGLRAGGYWLPKIAKEIAEATALVLLAGGKGLGPRQATDTEYYEALDPRLITQLYSCCSVANPVRDC